MRPRLVLAGFFGRGNCGDEALLQCVYEAFCDDYEITISVDEHGAFKGFWDWYPYNKARIVHQTNLGAVLGSSDVVGLHVGGGGLPPGFAANLATSARSSFRATAISGIDLWLSYPWFPVHSDAIADYLSLFDLAGIRHAIDPIDASTFARVEGRKVNVMHGADWALKLAADTDRDIQMDTKRVLCTLREFSIDRVPFGYVKSIERLIAQIERRGLRPAFLPFCPEDERFLGELALDRLAPSERHWWNPRRMKQLIANSGVMLSVGRLHPLVFAASTGTPVASVLPPGMPLAAEFMWNKVARLSNEFGIVTIDGEADLASFLDAPRPADRLKVEASERRLDAMIASLRELYAASADRFRVSQHAR